jgi:hypothetical protein
MNQLVKVRPGKAVTNRGLFIEGCGIDTKLFD